MVILLEEVQDLQLDDEKHQQDYSDSEFFLANPNCQMSTSFAFRDN